MARKINTLFGALVVMALVLSACAPAASSATQAPGGSVPVTAPTTAPAAPGQHRAGLEVQINGAGATFPYPLYSRWFYDYAFVDLAVKFNYQSIGSGGGIKQITEKTVDFGGFDAILTDEQY